MDFPHHHHHHHHRSEEEEEERREYYPPPGTTPPPPPPYHREPEFEAPRPPPSSQYYQDSDFAPHPPSHPKPYYQETGYAYQPPPPPPTAEVIHVSHEHAETHHSFRPHLPSFIHHHSGPDTATGIDLSSKATVQVYCKAEPNFHLTIRDGKVILAPADPYDKFQNWYKDEKYSTRVKDEEGSPSFALVNKATGEAMKHSIGESHPVQLIPYNPDVFDESILWTESKDLGDGYRAVRMVNNVHLNVDAFHGDKHSGGVHEGTTIVLWKWNKGENQRWKIIPN